MDPNPVWNADAHDDTVAVLAEYGQEVTFDVWGGDWCGDCRAQLPDFAAALAAADVPAENIHRHSVDQQKRGEGVEAYGIEFIPTVVVERDGNELARFVESEPVSIAAYLAEQLEAHLGAVDS